MTAAKPSSVKLSRELAVIPVEKYRLPKDRRKWSAVARNRMMLADFLGAHGDGDGTRIFPAVSTMAKKFGWSEAKTYYLLADLRELKLLEDTPHYSSPRHRRTRVRQLNLAAFLEPPENSGLQDTVTQDSKLEMDSKIQDSKIHTQDSKIHTQDSKIEVQDSNVTLETTATVTDTETVTLPSRQTAQQTALRSGVEAITPGLPDWIPLPLWSQFLKERKRRMSPAAQELAIQELDKLRRQGHSPEAVIRQSILNGWQGFFPFSGNGHQTPDQKLGLSRFHGPNPTVADRNARLIRNCEMADVIPKGTFEKICQELLARGTTLADDPKVLALCEALAKRVFSKS
jgi:hypothetical protein